MKGRQQDSPLVINLTANAGCMPSKSAEPVPYLPLGSSDITGLIAGATVSQRAWVCVQQASEPQT